MNNTTQASQDPMRTCEALMSLRDLLEGPPSDSVEHERTTNKD